MKYLLINQVGAAVDLQATLDNVWILIAAALVLFMQAGFALVEAGLTRAKNVANVMMKNMMDLCFGALAFFAVGFAIAFGGDMDGIGKFIGGGGWFLGEGSFTYGNLTAQLRFQIMGRRKVVCVRMGFQNPGHLQLLRPDKRDHLVSTRAPGSP